MVFEHVVVYPVKQFIILNNSILPNFAHTTNIHKHISVALLCYVPLYNMSVFTRTMYKYLIIHFAVFIKLCMHILVALITMCCCFLFAAIFILCAQHRKRFRIRMQNCFQFSNSKFYNIFPMHSPHVSSFFDKKSGNLLTNKINHVICYIEVLTKYTRQHMQSVLLSRIVCEVGNSIIEPIECVRVCLCSCVRMCATVLRFSFICL